MKENSSNIAEYIIKLREQQGLTQEFVANRLGLSRQSYILIEQGRRSLDVSELETLAELFGINTAEFFTQPRNNEKFQQMMLYILKLAEKRGVTKTKLAKLLYLADFRNFYEELEPMSGALYVRREYGPVADIFFELVDNLYDKGRIDIDKTSTGAMIVKSKTFEPDDSLLSTSEKGKIREIYELWKDKRTEEIVDYTHQQKPWSSCLDGEYIPYLLITQEDPEHVFAPIA
jgi:DNA-binding XRE family transcriptional regulator/uncharacterized phage-associated protein